MSNNTDVTLLKSMNEDLIDLIEETICKLDILARDRILNPETVARIADDVEFWLKKIVNGTN